MYLKGKPSNSLSLMADRITSNRCRMWLRTVNGIPPFIFSSSPQVHKVQGIYEFLLLHKVVLSWFKTLCYPHLFTYSSLQSERTMVWMEIRYRRCPIHGPDHIKEEERFRKVPWSNFPPLLMVFYNRKGNHNLHSLSIKLQPLGTCVRKFKRITTFMWTRGDLYPEVSKNNKSVRVSL